MDHVRHARLFKFSTLAAAALAIGLTTVPLGPVRSESDSTFSARRSIVIPLIDPERGKSLFVTKGCVICHAVQGVGGDAAPALDAVAPASNLDILDFVARLLRGAPAMLELQAFELGYQIELDGHEIADLAGFLSDPALQKSFSIDAVPEPMRDWFLDEPYWEDEDWPEDLPEDYPNFDDGADL